MHAKRKSQRLNAIISVFCALTLAFSLSMPYMAFAADETDPVTGVDVESSDISKSEDVNDNDSVYKDDVDLSDEGLSGGALDEDIKAEEIETDGDSEIVDPSLEESDDSQDEDILTSAAIPSGITPITSDPTVWQNIPVYDISGTGISSIVSLRGILNGTDIPAGSQVYARYELGGAGIGSDVVPSQLTDVCDGFVASMFVYLYVDGELLESNDLSLGSFEVTILRTPVGGDLSSIVYGSASSPRYVYIYNKNGFEQFVANGSPITVTPVMSGGISGLDVMVYGGYPVNSDEEITPEPSLTVTGNTGIKASGNLQGPNIPADADIEVATSAVTSGEAFDDLNNAMGDKRISDVFEITLLVNGVEVHDGFGDLTISMPVDSKYNGHVIVIYHRHQDGSITTSTAIARDGYVTFTVTDLSWFALEDGGLPAGSNVGSLAQTGDSTSALFLIIVASISAGLMCYLFLNNRTRRKALHAK